MMDATAPTIALIVAAGQGARAGGGLPKQYARLGGTAVVVHSFDAFAAHPAIDSILIVIGQGQEGLLAGAFVGRDVPSFITGGATRRESVMVGLEAIVASGGAARILIHDAARPFLSSAVIDRLLAALDSHEGAVPALPIADTLARDRGRLGETVPRDGLVRVQTPQAFRFDAIMTSHRSWNPETEATDDAQIARAAGFDVTIIQGDPALEKITHPQDFASAEAQLVARATTRTAMGYDVHRLVPGETLWLGGIMIPHTHGLSGHSDADVALHALTDALLGTIGAGDIGMHFPPSDPQWRDASSDQFLQHAASLIEQAGGIIDHVDVTIICESPKIGPHRDAMRARIADLLRLDIGKVSVKATTTERLGFTGREEGIAAQAVATVRILGDI